MAMSGNIDNGTQWRTEQFKLNLGDDLGQHLDPGIFNSFLSLHSWGGHSGKVVTLSPPTSEAGVRFQARPQVGKLVVGCRWSAVFSTEP